MRREDATQPSAAELVVRLEASRKALMDAIAGLDDAGFRARPNVSSWSVAEVLAHLLSTERFLGQRAQAAATGQAISISPRTADERARDAREAAQRMPVPQIIHGLLAQRRQTLRALEALSPEGLTRPVHHARHGDVDVAWLFQYIAEHETEHARQVRGLRSSVSADAS